MNGKRPGGWIALAWRAYRDPKVLSVSGEAELLWIHGLEHSGEHELDGNVQRRALKALSTKGRRSPMALAAELVAAGLWIETDDGFAVPFETWSRWQPTAEEAATSRAREAERKARWRRGTGHGTRRGTDAGQGQGQGQGPPYGASSVPHAARGNLIQSEPWIDDGGRWFVAPPAASTPLEPGDP